MANKKIQYKQHTALFLASVSLLVFGTCALYINGGINYTSVVASSTVVVPAVAIMYILGWLIGLVVETSKSIKKTVNVGYANNLLEEILQEEGLNLSENMSDDDDEVLKNVEPESKE